MALIPILNPDGIPTRGWRKKQNTTNSRLMTAAEILPKEAEEAKKRGNRRQRTLQLWQKNNE
jgi:hypothetical protein